MDNNKKMEYDMLIAQIQDNISIKKELQQCSIHLEDEITNGEELLKALNDIKQACNKLDEEIYQLFDKLMLIR